MPGVDVFIPTVDNPVWLERCKQSLGWNTNPDHMARVLILAGNPQSWLEKMQQALTMVETDLLLCIQDDCIILPGSPDWIARMLVPFSLDPAVGVVFCCVTAGGSPAQRAQRGHPPGYYYTTSFAPILFLAKPKALSDGIRGIEHDLTCDQDVPLNLLEEGWKIVAATNVCQYHEGMQTNLKVYFKDDLDNPARLQSAIEAMEAKIKEEVPKRHRKVWCARLDACEMIPMPIP